MAKCTWEKPKPIRPIEINEFFLKRLATAYPSWYPLDSYVFVQDYVNEAWRRITLWNRKWFCDGERIVDKKRSGLNKGNREVSPKYYRCNNEKIFFQPPCEHKKEKETPDNFIAGIHPLELKVDENRDQRRNEQEIQTVQSSKKN